MSSFFPFSTSSSSVNTIAPQSNDPHLEVTVTPSSSAFYAGETFSVSITFSNTRLPNDTSPAVYHEPQTPETALPSEVGTATSSFRGMPTLDPDPRMMGGPELPRRKNQIGTSKPSTPNANAMGRENSKSPIPPYMMGETRGGSASYVGYPYSPGANPASRAGWPAAGKDGEGMVIRSPETWRRSYGDLGTAKGHERRTRSWALGNKGMTPQEMVWSLGGQASECAHTASVHGSGSVVDVQLPLHSLRDVRLRAQLSLALTPTRARSPSTPLSFPLSIVLALDHQASCRLSLSPACRATKLVPVDPHCAMHIPTRPPTSPRHQGPSPA
jgi:hypothetical protein